MSEFRMPSLYELAAIPPKTLREMVGNVLEQDTEEAALRATKELEDADRRILNRFVIRVRKSA